VIAPEYEPSEAVTIGPLMRVTTFARASTRSCAVALLALACQKEAPREHREPEPAPLESAAAPAPPAAASPPDAGAKPAPAAEQPFSGQDQRVGNFIETSAYKFRVDAVVRCADPAPTETVPEDRKVRVAAKVGVFSKYDELFVSAQDVTLEKDGVVINSERKLKTSTECAPLLEQKRLKHDETLTGFVVFQVPNDAFVKDSIVAFKPTRWGGAPRTEIKVEAKDFVAGKAGAATAEKL
jgi:hypothetical protein